MMNTSLIRSLVLILIAFTVRDYAGAERCGALGDILWGGTVGIPSISSIYSVAHPMRNRHFVKAMKIFRLLFYRNGVIFTDNLTP